MSCEACRIRRGNIGTSRDKDARLEDHNLGKAASTRLRRPFVRTYFECFESIGEGRKREKYFKTAAGRRYLDQVETPVWELLQKLLKLNRKSDPPDRTTEER